MRAPSLRITTLLRGWSMWQTQHQAAAGSSWRKLKARPLATFLTWLLVALSLGLPASLLLTLNNLSAVTAHFERPPQFSLLLTEATDLNGAVQLKQTLERWPGIASVELIPKEEALTQFSALTGLDALLDSLSRNPLPHTLLVASRNGASDAESASLMQRLKGIEGVARVVLDTLWMTRLEEGLRVASRWVLALGAMMLLATVLALGNTLRLTVIAREDEILVVRLIGGSMAYARRPFLYTGLWHGLGGGVLGAVILWLFCGWLAGPVNALFVLYESQQRLQWPGMHYPLALLGVAVFLSWSTSWLACERHLRQLERH
jgi:cell division transport system permease protein